MQRKAVEKPTNIIRLQLKCIAPNTEDSKTEHKTLLQKISMCEDIESLTDNINLGGLSNKNNEKVKIDFQGVCSNGSYKNNDLNGNINDTLNNRLCSIINANRNKEKKKEIKIKKIISKSINSDTNSIKNQVPDKNNAHKADEIRKSILFGTNENNDFFDKIEFTDKKEEVQKSKKNSKGLSKLTDEDIEYESIDFDELNENTLLDESKINNTSDSKLKSAIKDEEIVSDEIEEFYFIPSSSTDNELLSENEEIKNESTNVVLTESQLIHFKNLKYENSKIKSKNDNKDTIVSGINKSSKSNNNISCNLKQNFNQYFDCEIVEELKLGNSNSDLNNLSISSNKLNTKNKIKKEKINGTKANSELNKNNLYNSKLINIQKYLNSDDYQSINELFNIDNDKSIDLESNLPYKLNLIKKKENETINAKAFQNEKHDAMKNKNDKEHNNYEQKHSSIEQNKYCKINNNTNESIKKEKFVIENAINPKNKTAEFIKKENKNIDGKTYENKDEVIINDNTVLNGKEKINIMDNITIDIPSEIKDNSLNNLKRCNLSILTKIENEKSIKAAKIMNNLIFVFFWTVSDAIKFYKSIRGTQRINFVTIPQYMDEKYCSFKKHIEAEIKTHSTPFTSRHDSRELRTEHLVGLGINSSTQDMSIDRSDIFMQLTERIIYFSKISKYFTAGELKRIEELFNEGDNNSILLNAKELCVGCSTNVFMQGVLKAMDKKTFYELVEILGDDIGPISATKYGAYVIQTVLGLANTEDIQSLIIRNFQKYASLLLTHPLGNYSIQTIGEFNTNFLKNSLLSDLKNICKTHIGIRVFKKNLFIFDGVYDKLLSAVKLCDSATQNIIYDIIEKSVKEK